MNLMRWHYVSYYYEIPFSPPGLPPTKKFSLKNVELPIFTDELGKADGFFTPNLIFKNIITIKLMI